MAMTAAAWGFVGVALIFFEIVTPGLVTLFFGLSALTVALLMWLMPGLPPGWQWGIFTILSVAYIFLLRKSLKKIFSGAQEVSDNVNDEYTGKLAVVTEVVAPNKPGRVELGGTTWTAEADRELPAGASVRVVRKKNLTLKIEAV